MPKTKSLFGKLQTSSKPAALLWDESFLWGIMAHRTLSVLSLPFDLLRAEDIRAGELANYRLLFVPGGWASNKLKALGEEGAERIRDFVAGGGNYFGICGGAGLATTEGLNLAAIGRRPTSERVPSFSGRIQVEKGRHPLWRGVRERSFHAWWPSQFVVQDDGVRVVGRYGAPHAEAMTSDLSVGDVEAAGGWEELEKLYRINLDPGRLAGEPAVVTARYGSGDVLLSLLHFDTPGDVGGGEVLRNIWQEMAGAEPGSQNERNVTPEKTPMPSAFNDMVKAISGLIDLGGRHFLWYWRTPMLLQWRRGVRGLEYCTLYNMVNEIERLVAQQPAIRRSETFRQYLAAVHEPFLAFIEQANRLLVLERIAMQNGHITYERCDDPEVIRLRRELFSSSKSYGGKFKDVLDGVDGLLYLLLRQEL